MLLKVPLIRSGAPSEPRMVPLPPVLLTTCVRSEPLKSIVSFTGPPSIEPIRRENSSVPGGEPAGVPNSNVSSPPSPKRSAVSTVPPPGPVIENRSAPPPPRSSANSASPVTRNVSTAEPPCRISNPAKWVVAVLSVAVSSPTPSMAQLVASSRPVKVSLPAAELPTKRSTFCTPPAAPPLMAVAAPVARFTLTTASVLAA